MRQDDATRLPYRHLMCRLLAEAVKSHDTNWLLSPMGQIVMDAMDYDPGIKERILEAARPTRRRKSYDRRKYLYKGRMLSVSQIAREVGIKEATIRQRLKRGWSIENALGKEVQKKGGDE